MLDSFPHLPEQKRLLLERLVVRLSAVPGIAAIVLGGSYASGEHHDASDMDIGLYYFEAAPFAIEDIRQIAKDISVDGTPTVTGFYEWGAWVNGGAWIQTPHGKVDFLYSSLDHVRKVIADAHDGISHHDYDQQPTHGFYSVIYLAETQVCIPLHDPESCISDLKSRVAVYPPKLKQTLVNGSLWSAEFTLLYARNFAAQGDVYNTVGCMTRVVANLTQALFALNERYFMRDKKVLETIAGFASVPADYGCQIEQILANPGRSADALTRSVGELERVWRSVTALPGVRYSPMFRI
jgi:predicted nucleotidyltransferase